MTCVLMCQPSASKAIECDIRPADDLDNHHRGSDTDHDPRAPFRMRKIRNEIVSLTKTRVIGAMHVDSV